tara:strand:- start:884 stop:1714 length:831 start_codon:yes stop_codon:yes gene_type:complete
VSLPNQLIDKLPLILVPFEIHHGLNVYRDGVDISPAHFYHLQSLEQPLPITSAPSPEEFMKAFKKASEISKEIICLTLSKDLSATYQAAWLAYDEMKKAFPGFKVTLIDTKTAAAAEGLIALKAARLSANGVPTEKVIQSINDGIDKIKFIGRINTFYYVWKSGRLHRAGHVLGTMLNIKPILDLESGKVGIIAKPRGNNKSFKLLVELIKKQMGVRKSRLLVVHAHALDKAQDLAARLEGSGNIEELILTEFTPVIGAHTGPGLIGCAIEPIDSV